MVILHISTIQQHVTDCTRVYLGGLSARVTCHDGFKCSNAAGYIYIQVTTEHCRLLLRFVQCISSV